MQLQGRFQSFLRRGLQGLAGALLMGASLTGALAQAVDCGQLQNALTAGVRGDPAAAARFSEAARKQQYELERTVATQTVPTIFEGTRIAVAELGEDRLLIGAAELALADTLENPESVSSRR